MTKVHDLGEERLVAGRSPELFVELSILPSTLALMTPRGSTRLPDWGPNQRRDQR